jgi:hypothetical protein
MKANLNKTGKTLLSLLLSAAIIVAFGAVVKGIIKLFMLGYNLL